MKSILERDGKKRTAGDDQTKKCRPQWPQLLGRLRKGGREFKVNLDNLLRPCLKIRRWGVVQ